VQIIDNIPVWGASIEKVMADHHKGYGVPIGGVIAHETLVSPSGVGYDIG
jgi:tRNA-splicing ligase RtcB